MVDVTAKHYWYYTENCIFKVGDDSVDTELLVNGMAVIYDGLEEFYVSNINIKCLIIVENASKLGN